MVHNSPDTTTEDLFEVSVPDRRAGDPQVRLSLSLSPKIAKVLKDYAQAHDVTVTEAVRRAVSVLDFVDEIENDEGAALAVARGDAVREVRFRW
jgi:hypothetical protein